MRTRATAAHVALCEWSRELMLALLASEGLKPSRCYTWADEWFVFSFGLGGDKSDQSAPGRQEANREGLRLREQCSAYAQEVLSDIALATPADPGFLVADDFVCLRQRWGILTEAATELGLPVPVEIEWLVNEPALPDALGLLT